MICILNGMLWNNNKLLSLGHIYRWKRNEMITTWLPEFPEFKEKCNCENAIFSEYVAADSCFELFINRMKKWRNYQNYWWQRENITDSGNHSEFDDETPDDFKRDNVKSVMNAINIF